MGANSPLLVDQLAVESLSQQQPQVEGAVELRGDVQYELVGRRHHIDISDSERWTVRVCSRRQEKRRSVGDGLKDRYDGRWRRRHGVDGDRRPRTVRRHGNETGRVVVDIHHLTQTHREEGPDNFTGRYLVLIADYRGAIGTVDEELWCRDLTSIGAFYV